MRNKVWLLFLCLMISHTVSYGHGDVGVLIARLDGQIEASPGNAELLLQRANFLRQHKEYGKALLDLARVEEIAPQLPERYYVLAKIHLAQQNWKPAREALDAYIAIHAADSEPYALRSRTLWKLGETTRAEQDALQAINLHSRAPLQLHLNYIKLLLERNDIEAALAAYARAEESLGSLPSLLMAKARMFSDHERFVEASATYAQLRELQPMLGFSCWLKEASMWADQDHRKASEATQQARLAWEALPPRQRASMKDNYVELLKQEKGDG